VCVIAVRFAEVPNDHVEPVSPVETVITPLRRSVSFDHHRTVAGEVPGGR
jgi:hypothetical protein